MVTHCGRLWIDSLFPYKLHFKQESTPVRCVPPAFLVPAGGGGSVSAHPRMQTPLSPDADPQRQTFPLPWMQTPLVMSPVKHAEKPTPSPPL